MARPLYLLNNIAFYLYSAYALMNYVALGSTVLHIVFNAFGIFANSLLIFLVLKKTLGYLATYSILIFNFALCDLLTCVSALFVQQRIIPGGLGLYYFSHGLQVLRIDGMLCCVSFSFASDNVNDVKVAIATRFGYNMTGECVSGHLDILEWKKLFTILNATITVGPQYAAIPLLIRGIASKLNSVKTISENSRLLHSQLLKALTYQACLPIFLVFAVITYSTGQLNLYHHPALEYSTFILAGIVPVLSPLTSFRFIYPYRSWIRKELLRRNSAAVIVSETSISVLQRSFISRRSRRDLWNSH